MKTADTVASDRSIASFDLSLQDGGPVCPRVVTFAPFKLHIITAVGECGEHLFVSEGPATVLIIEVIGAILQENLDWLACGVPDEPGVIVPPTDVCE